MTGPETTAPGTTVSGTTVPETMPETAALDTQERQKVRQVSREEHLMRNGDGNHCNIVASALHLSCLYQRTNLALTGWRLL